MSTIAVSVPDHFRQFPIARDLTVGFLVETMGLEPMFSQLQPLYTILLYYIPIIKIKKLSLRSPQLWILLSIIYFSPGNRAHQSRVHHRVPWVIQTSVG